MLLSEFSVPSSRTPILVEGITIDRMIEYTRRYFVKGGAMKDHRGGDKLYHLAHC